MQKYWETSERFVPSIPTRHSLGDRTSLCGWSTHDAMSQKLDQSENKKTQQIILRLMEENSELRKNQYKLIEQITLLKIELESKEIRAKEIYLDYQKIISRTEITDQQKPSGVNTAAHKVRLSNNQSTSHKKYSVPPKGQLKNNQISFPCPNPESYSNDQSQESSVLSQLSQAIDPFEKVPKLPTMEIFSKQSFLKASANRNTEANSWRNRSARHSCANKQVNEKIQKIISNYKLHKGQHKHS